MNEKIYDGKSFNKIFEFQDYYLIKEDNVFKIVIIKMEKILLIKYKNYQIQLNIDDLSELIKIKKFNSIEEGYKYINSIFEENRIKIKNITINKMLALELKLDLNKDIIINLIYHKDHQNIIVDELKELKMEIYGLKEEIKNLKKEISELIKRNDIKNIHEDKTENEIKTNKSNPDMKKIKDIQILKEFNIDSFTDCYLDNTFTVFKSVNNILNLIYTNKSNSIISYDLVNNKTLNEIKNAHNDLITSFRHFLDKNNNEDLIISLSSEDNCLKLWNINNLECLLNLQNVNKEGFLFSACMLNSLGSNYIITSNCMWNSSPEAIKVFDLNGKKIKEIEDSIDAILFLDIYYDKKLHKNFIVSGSLNGVKSYVFDEGKLYHKYFDNYISYHCSIIVNDIEEIVKLIESSTDGHIRIWNFHSPELLNKIKITNNWLYGICLMSEKYLFVGCTNNIIKIIDIEKGKIIRDLIGHKSRIICIKKVNHPIFGECILSQGYKNGQIKLWITKK